VDDGPALGKANSVTTARSVRILSAFLLLAACRSTGREPLSSQDSGSSPRLAAPDVARDVVAALKTHDMIRLSTFVDSTDGLRFSPYPHLNDSDRRFTPAAVASLWTDTTAVVWGIHDGSGQPILLDYPSYHASFVYDVDFANADTVAIDQPPIGKGNVINNIRDLYPDATIVEIHDRGSNPEAGGMDWRSLWLVLKSDGTSHGAYRLVAIVHGAWTI
jgi:hypothetical protein